MIAFAWRRFRKHASWRIAHNQCGLACGALFAVLCVLLPTTAQAGHYELLMSQDDALCQHLQGIYNEDMKRHGAVRYADHAEFNWVRWQERLLSFRSAGSPAGSPNWEPALMAVFDVNNDSVDEVIIRSLTMFRGNEYDQYVVLDASVAMMLGNEIVGKDYGKLVLFTLSDISSAGRTIDASLLRTVAMDRASHYMKRYIKEVIKSQRDWAQFVGRSTAIQFVKHGPKVYVVTEGPRPISQNEHYEDVEHYSLVTEFSKGTSSKGMCLYSLKNTHRTRAKSKQ